MNIENAAGTYILLLHMEQPTQIKVGRLGVLDFLPGWYTYVGSAFGAGGLRGRLKHHLSPVKRPHWHIDYLRQAAVCQRIWYAASDTPYEHVWAAALHKLSGVPVARFGASDCRCEAHLFHFAACPDLEQFRTFVPAPDAVQCWYLTNNPQ